MASWLRWIIGQPILIIEDGKIIPKNLKRARMTEDDLKMQLRMQKIADITKVKHATFEVSGYMGIELYPEHAQVTKKEFDSLKQAIDLIAKKLDIEPQALPSSNKTNKNLFQQIEKIHQNETQNNKQ
ncbi:YetF domain-containing protein [Lederbergia citrea]|uniref:DUF421 domain-containing protein n=1 Tax=Lederbergia citrea TaxID=2833581 RepID=A0A942Z218_9BACI|nr:YetF domain-containing protein [Lederbergia citrea]MBS4222058.1 DUF421 domain-containing protein [Lederbergia citrea]